MRMEQIKMTTTLSVLQPFCFFSCRNAPQIAASLRLTPRVIKQLNLRFKKNFSHCLNGWENFYKSLLSHFYWYHFFVCFCILICRLTLSRKSLSLFLHSSESSSYMAVSTQCLRTLGSEWALTLAAWDFSLVMTLGMLQILSLSQKLDWCLGSKPLSSYCCPKLAISYEM